MAVRALQINLDANITNFIERLSRANSAVESWGSELTNALTRISLNAKLHTANLGHMGSASAKMRIESQALTEKIKFQTVAVEKMTREYEAYKTEANEASTKTRKMGEDVSRATTKLVEMKNSVKSLAMAMEQIPVDTKFQRMAYIQNIASLHTRQLVADLGHEATEIQKLGAAIEGLGSEWQALIKSQELLKIEINRLIKLEGDHTAALRTKTTELRAAELAAQEMQNTMLGSGDKIKAIQAEEKAAIEATTRALREQAIAAAAARASTAVAGASHGLSLAGIATGTMVAGLGYGASELERTKAETAGLRGQRTEQLATLSAMRGALGILQSLEGDHIAAIQQQQVAYAQLRLTALETYNAIQANVAKTVTLEQEEVNTIHRATRALREQALVAAQRGVNLAQIRSQNLLAGLPVGADAIDTIKTKIVGLKGEVEALRIKLNAAEKALSSLHHTRIVARLPEHRALVASAEDELAQARLNKNARLKILRESLAEERKLINARSLALQAEPLKLASAAQVSAQALNSIAAQRAVANLGINATPLQQARAEVPGLNTAWTDSLKTQGLIKAEIRRTMALEGDHATTLKQLEIQYQQAGLTARLAYNAMQTGIVRVTQLEREELNAVMATRLAREQANRTSAFANIEAQQRRASIASRQLIADLGHTATAEQRVAAQIAGWNRELEVNVRYQRILDGEINRLRTSTGNYTNEVRRLITAQREARLAGTTLQNNIAEAQAGGGGGSPIILPGGSGIMGLIGQLTMAALVAKTLFSGVGVGIEYNKMIETNTTSFKVLTGSMYDAQKLMSEMTKMAMVTPFETEDLTKQGTTLAQYGIALRNIMPTLKLLGDVSLGRKEKFEVIAYNFAQAAALGRLTAIDARSMTLAGFNPLTAIADMRKKRGDKPKAYSIAGLQKEMEDTGLPMKDLVLAMQQATSEGGRFYMAMEEQSKTLEGRLSTLRDVYKQLMGKLMEPISLWLADVLIPTLTGAIMWVRKFVDMHPTIVLMALSIATALVELVAFAGAIWLVTKLGGGFAWLEKMISKVTQPIITATKAVGKFAAKLFTANAASWTMTLKVVAVTLAVALLGAALYAAARNWEPFKNVAAEAWEVIKNTTKLSIAIMRVVFNDFITGLMRGFDKVAYQARTAAAFDFKGMFFGTAPESDITKSWKTDTLTAVDDAFAAFKALRESAHWYNEAKRIFGESVGDNMLADIKTLKAMWTNFWPDFEMPEFKYDAGKMDLDDWLSTLKTSVDDAMENLIKRVLDKAKEFRDALGFFERAIVEKISPERLFLRLQAQLKVFSNWKADMASLKLKLGEDSPLYQDTLKQGVKGAGKAHAINLMDRVLLENVRSMYGNYGGMALGPAGEVVGSELRAERALKNSVVNININGGVVLGNIRDLVDAVTTEILRLGVV